MSVPTEKLPEVENEFVFSPDQVEALNRLYDFAGGDYLSHALAGPAGSGKTTLMKTFIENCSQPVVLSAMTHKAAAVLMRQTGRQAHTLHSALGLVPERNYSTGKLDFKVQNDIKAFPGCVLVVDECSMVDAAMLQLIEDIADIAGFQVLFVGDWYQLPPIEDGVCPVFDSVETSYLTTVHRQALENPVLHLANRFRLVLEGEPMPAIRTTAFHGIVDTVIVSPRKEFERQMLSAFSSEGRADTVALAWTNERVHALNRLVREHLWGEVASEWAHIEDEVFVANTAITRHDELVLRNNSEVRILHSIKDAVGVGDNEVVEGERVRVMTEDGAEETFFVPTNWSHAKMVLKRYRTKALKLTRAVKAGDRSREGDRRKAWRDFFALDQQLVDLRPSYASTVHKAQGSTFENVFVDAGDIGRCPDKEMLARLMYVATSRASVSATFTLGGRW